MHVQSFSVSKLVYFQIMFGGLLETISLCYITMVMLTVVPITPNAIILVLCSLPMMPAIWEAINSRSRWRTLAGKLDFIKFVTSAAFAVIGIALLLCKVRNNKRPSGPVSLIVWRTERGYRDELMTQRALADNSSFWSFLNLNHAS